MYKLGEIFRSDGTWPARAKFCNENNMRIVEIEPDEFGKRFMIRELYTDSEKAEIEINEMKIWFDVEYCYKEQKYRRLMALNKKDDDGVDANVKLLELYEEAENKRALIQELEKQLNT